MPDSREAPWDSQPHVSLGTSSLTDACTLSKVAPSQAPNPSSPGKGQDAQLSPPEEALWTTRIDGRVRLRVDCGSAQQPPCTVHQMFCRTLEKYGGLRALGFKRQGVWEHISYSQYYLLARRAAKGFLKLGLERAHSVAILGSNSPEWFFSAVGTVFAGGVATGIYTTSSPEACQYIIHDCRANIIVLDSQEQLAKILQIWKTLPRLKAVVMYREPPPEKMARVYTMEDVLELGAQVPEEDLDTILDMQRPNQCCVVIYTSGTTGLPKGVMLSQDNITWMAQYSLQESYIFHPHDKQEVIVSYLPLSHVAAQIYDLWVGIHTGTHVCFAEPDAMKGSIMDTLREVEPTFYLAVPRIWEKIMEHIQEVIASSGFVWRRVLLWAMSVMLEQNLACPDSSPKPIKARLVDYLVLAKVRQALGFARCQMSFYGAAPIAAEVELFFLGLNLRLYSAYGLSESSGIQFLSGTSNYRLRSSGKLVPGCQVKLVNQDADGAGEICLWGRSIFMGYLNKEDKTCECIDADGWLHTGDIGRLDADGFLYITGRIKELIITAGGENVSPVPIEDAVRKELPIINCAMLIGDQRKFLSMLLTLKCILDPDTFEPTDHLTEQAVEFCQQVGSTATTISKIVGTRDEAVYRAIEEGIQRVNRKAVARAHHIQKWAVLERDFSISGGELGPTMKLKRGVVLEKYKAIIDSFYQEQSK
uniref:Long-chain-fatty-acid--CoA ligase ACSBG1 n=1 Tax=Rousettus aegyptiacus TaxID=9407 RepID=A0A7J8CD86_ROUAE|nr:acyl-CoA synthetase bubblegum family member 1 [Rousettus aegyptiacus]